MKYQRLLTGQIFKKQGNFHFLGDLGAVSTGLKPLKSSQELTGQKICPMVFHGKNWKLSKILKKFTEIKNFFKTLKILRGKFECLFKCLHRSKEFSYKQRLRLFLFFVSTMYHYQKD